METTEQQRVDRQTDSSGNRPQNGHRFPQHRSPKTGLVSGAVTALTLTLSFALLAIGFEYFWVTYIVGFGFFLPAATNLVSSRQNTTGRTGAKTGKDTAGTPLEELRYRYATGKLTDEEFERQVERLVETEDKS